jgi:putative Holliday junction resolvase
MIEEKILCLDFGEARIGLARSEENFAVPYGFLANDATFFDKLSLVLEEYDIKKIIIGMPEKTSQMAQEIKKFGQKVSRFFHGSVEYWDEKYSTAEANMILKSRGKTVEESKPLVDALSASLVLQSYLDAQKGKV